MRQIGNKRHGTKWNRRRRANEQRKRERDKGRVVTAKADLVEQLVKKLEANDK